MLTDKRGQLWHQIKAAKLLDYSYYSIWTVRAKNGY